VNNCAMSLNSLGHCDVGLRSTSDFIVAVVFA